MKAAIPALAVLLAAMSAQAQGAKFTPPAGCDAYLTVQMKSCLVAHYFTCAGDPEGHRWGATLTEMGPAAMSYVDDEYQWLRTVVFFRGVTEELRQPSVEPASMSELLETGLDTFDFETVSSGAINGQVSRYQGFDRLTGEETEIDGMPLLVTEFEVNEYVDGALVFARKGNQYVSDRFRLFFGGIETESNGTETVESDTTPVQFIEPGEPGFLDADPIFDCGAVMSSVPAPVVPVGLTK